MRAGGREGARAGDDGGERVAGATSVAGAAGSGVEASGVAGAAWTAGGEVTAGGAADVPSVESDATFADGAESSSS